MTPPAEPGGPAGLDLPELDGPLGSLDFQLRAVDAVGPLALGRRAEVVRNDPGIDVTIDGVTIAGRLRVRDATREATEVTPLGAESVLVARETRIVQRVLASRDAPVVWLEWERSGEREDRPAESVLELEWACESWADDRAFDGETVERGWVARRPAGEEAGDPVIFVFGVPVELAVPSSPTDPVRARLPLGQGGVRLAIAAPGPDDDLDRLLRVMGRTRVAAPARRAAADRALKEGLRLTARGPHPPVEAGPAAGDASAPDLGDAVAWARLRLADARPLPHGAWEMDDVVRAAEARLMAGDHASVLGLLDTLAALAVDGTAPTRGVGTEALEHGARGSGLFRRLRSAYIDWAGDPAGAGRAAEAAGLRDGQVEDPQGGVTKRPAEPPGPASPHPDPAVVLGWLVRGLLGAEPDASRGRLVLRPRPPERWIGFEVQGLKLGPAEVALAYEREGHRQRLTLRQLRGAAPLQVVLAPELSGGRVVRVAVDDQPADLDIERVGDRWRIPVQLVPDRTRRLEVEFVDPAD